jgi:hypothetical protein
MAAAAPQPETQRLIPSGVIRISNQVRLDRFESDIRNNYNQYETSFYEIPYKKLRDAILAELREHVSTDTPQDFGTRIHESYDKLWDKSLNAPGYMNTSRQGAIEIVAQGTEGTKAERIIKVKSYGGKTAKYPKGDIHQGEDTFSAAKRELREETSIDIDTHPDFRGMVPEERQDNNWDYTKNISVYRYIVPIHVYNSLITHMQTNAVNNPLGTADITSIHYKKYMKYKAKYLALVKSMGK